MYGEYNEIFSLILCSLSYQTWQCLLLCDKDLHPNDRGIADEGEKNQAEDFQHCRRQPDLIIIKPAREARGPEGPARWER